MKNEKGITLVSLVVTIILLFVLATITTSAGLESYRTMQVQTFVAKMKVIQAKVSVIKADYKNWKPAPGQGTTLHDYLADELGFTQWAAVSETEQKAFGGIIQKISATNPTSWSDSDDVPTNYFYFGPQDITNKLGLKNVDGVTVIINFETGNVIERQGVINPKKNNLRIYRQYDYSGGDQLINGSTPNLAYVDDSQGIIDYSDAGGAGGISGESGVGINEQYSAEGLLVNETRLNAQGLMLRVYLTENHGNLQRFKIALLDLTGNKTTVNIQNLKYMADNIGRSVWMDAGGDERVSNITYNQNEVIFDVKITDNYNFAIENSNYDLLAVNGKIDVTLVNPPKLAAGMVPVYWREVEEGDLVTNKLNELTSSAQDQVSPFWYNYAKDQKHWANAKTQDGSYWVWIPRFSYLYDTNAESIDVKFLKGITTDPFDGQTNNFNIHPSFTYQTAVGSSTKIYPAGQWDEDITGFWIAKYDVGNNETSYQEEYQEPYTYTYEEEYQVYDYVLDENGNRIKRNGRWVKDWITKVRTVSETRYRTAYRTVTNTVVQSVPGVQFQDKKTYEQVVTQCDTMKGYMFPSTVGNNVDLHLMRNSEWGAVSYLTWSKYGAKFVANNASTYSAGMSKYDKDNYEDFEAEVYTTPKYIGMTTTANPYGLYDMVGGVSNMVSAMTYERLVTESTKAVTLYSFIRNDNRIPGDAIYEVTKEDLTEGKMYRTWGGYLADYPTASMIFLRGGDSDNSSNRNGIFAYSHMPFSVQESVYNNVGFRPGLVVK